MDKNAILAEAKKIVQDYMNFRIECANDSKNEPEDKRIYTKVAEQCNTTIEILQHIIDINMY